MNPATLKQAAKLLAQFAEQDPSADRMQQILDGHLPDLLKAPTLPERDAFRQFLGLGNLHPELTELPGVVIPGSKKTWGERIADGGYGWIDSDITENRFPLLLPAGPRELVLAYFNKLMTTERVKAWSAEHGYEVALIDDLLAVGAHPEYRELQRQFPIPALGSSAVVDGRRSVPCLNRHGSVPFQYGCVI